MTPRQEALSLVSDRRTLVEAALSDQWMTLRDIAWKAGVAQISARGHLGALVKAGVAEKSVGHLVGSHPGSMAVVWRLRTSR